MFCILLQVFVAMCSGNSDDVNFDFDNYTIPTVPPFVFTHKDVVNSQKFQQLNNSYHQDTRTFKEIEREYQRHAALEREYDKETDDIVERGESNAKKFAAQGRRFSNRINEHISKMIAEHEAYEKHKNQMEGTDNIYSGKNSENNSATIAVGSVTMVFVFSSQWIVVS